MPSMNERGVAKDKITKKYACKYDADEGQVRIWYKDATNPGQSGFGKIVAALRLAREVVNKAVTRLEKEPDSKHVKNVLGYHFGGNKVANNTTKNTNKGEVPRLGGDAIGGSIVIIEQLRPSSQIVSGRWSR